MYTTKYNRIESREEQLHFIRENGFAILLSTVRGRPWATHIPLHLSEDGLTLSGHEARGNGQWKEFEKQEVLAVFSGPHTYISSSWYDHENVPTWNYLAVHVYGTVRIVENEELVESLRRLVNKYEKNSERPVTMEGMSKDFLKTKMQGIVGFEIKITSIEAAYKLSQNRDAKNYNNIINELEKKADAQSVEIANEMKKRSVRRLLDC